MRRSLNVSGECMVEENAWTRAWGTRHVLRHPSRQPGSYAIHLDPQGERSFLYWREAAGQAVAYDSIFRPQLWADPVEARAASARAMRACTIGLPTDSDEAQIWGAPDHASALLARWREAGVPLVAMKAGAEGCLCLDGSAPPLRYPAELVEVVDTSGAGDAFNGGFLDAWLAGQPVDAMAAAGQSLAAACIGHRGAIRSG